eukprot:7382768-Prymnesium_polylepis.1
MIVGSKASMVIAKVSRARRGVAGGCRTARARALGGGVGTACEPIINNEITATDELDASGSWTGRRGTERSPALRHVGGGQRTPFPGNGKPWPLEASGALAL